MFRPRTRQTGVVEVSGTDEWIDNEVMGCQFQDVRHGKRMRQLLEQLFGE